MSNKNEESPQNNVPSKKRRRKKKKKSVIKTVIKTILLLSLLGAIAIGVYIFTIIQKVPDIDPKNILNELNLSSNILDKEGSLIEQIQSEENRTIVELKNTPKHLQNAFISIEDERFWDHSGVDPIGILGSFLDNIRARGTVRGGSTITQQLARNVYLSNEVRLERKIKEAYIAMKLEKSLSKKEILEAYMNSIYLGNGAYGVQEASKMYFSKDVKDITLNESAVLAGITQSPLTLPPFILLKPQDVSPDSKILGEKLVLGETFSVVFNPKSEKRQSVILDKMLSLKNVSKANYEKAKSKDLIESILPGEDSKEEVSSYFIDYVKNQVLKDLVKYGGYSEEVANNKLYSGGLKIYSTVDIKKQKEVEDLYDNFASHINSGKMINWKNDPIGNIISEENNNKIVYYKKENILNENGDMFFSEGEFSKNENGDITIESPKLNVVGKSIDVSDYFTPDESKNIKTHQLGSLLLGEGTYSAKSGKITFKAGELASLPDFLVDGSDGSLIIKASYFYNNTDGVIQPQSATVVLEKDTSEIKVMVGGRNFEGKGLLNRSVTPRQTGSAMKPIGAYLPALDNGFKASTAIDDSPFYDAGGTLWPNNYDLKYRGLTSLRDSVQLSVNVNAVRAVDKVGIKKSMSYLRKMGIIRKDGSDSFVTSEENPNYNDETLAGIALGGLTYGISPLDMTGSYNSISNGGTYIQPRSYTKVVDRSGKVVLNNKLKKNKVVSPQVAFVMTDILKSTVSEGLLGAQKARISGSNSGIPIAGKTGTTDDSADVWFVGYSPYYTGSVWIGNDNPSIKLTKDSGLASEVFSKVMTIVHKELPDKDFDEPDGIVRRSVCTVSGGLATKLCSQDPRGNKTREEIFVKGTQSLGSCDMHVSVKIDAANGKLATSKTPASRIVHKVFFDRDPAYDPSKHGGIETLDYNLGPPKERSSYSEPEKPKEKSNDILLDILPEEDSGEIIESVPPTNNSSDSVPESGSSGSSSGSGSSGNSGGSSGSGSSGNSGGSSGSGSSGGNSGGSSGSGSSGSNPGGSSGSGSSGSGSGGNSGGSSGSGTTGNTESSNTTNNIN